MSTAKERLTVTVDARLVAAGHRAVAAGRARSLSSWVNLALAERVAEEERLRAMADAVAAFEAEHGVLRDAELAAQRRRDETAAVVVRDRRRGRARAVRDRRAAG